MLDVEVSWRAAFVNITGRCGNHYILLSMRPVEGTVNWERSTRGPITAVRLRDVPAASPNHPDVEARQSPALTSVGGSPVDTFPVPANQPTDGTAVMFREMEIIEEVRAGQAWAIPPLFDIPFSSVTGAPNVHRPPPPSNRP